MAGREHEEQDASAEADQQDRRADTRDLESDRADMHAHLHEWLHDDHQGGATFDQRQTAGRNRTTTRFDRHSAAIERSRAIQKVDVEVRVDGPDGPTWWPGLLYQRDWEKRHDRWICSVRYSTPDPDDSDQRPTTRNAVFDTDDIRQVAS